MLAKKCLFIAIFTLLSLSLAIADPPAEHPTTGEPLVIDCLRGTPDAIDGDLSDWNLDTMTPAVLDAQEQLSDDSSDKTLWDSPEDNSGKFYLLWDDENIYIAVVMKDDKLSMNKTGDSIWNADCIEVFFSTLNAVADCSEHYQYGFNANEQKWNWCNMDGNGSREPDYLQIAFSETADGYICEASIAYGQMLSLDFSVGNTIGFHPVFDDTDNGDRELQMTWTGRIAHDQSQGFGHIFLSDAAISGGSQIARSPYPANGAMYSDIWVNLGWSPGPTAVSHDVYIGDNFDDVNDGTPETFWANLPLTTTELFVGFFGYPYPDGLVPGTTYYWRIDEVNDTDPNSPWKGNVWSFWIQPRTVYEPGPADGAKFIDPNAATLSWSAGLGARIHYVYFGDNFDDVNNATEGLQHATTTYTPDPLELDKTYYWRIDEFDAITIHKGDVWSFTTAGLGGGVRADYYKGMNFGTHVLTRIDPQINFNWGDGEPDPLVGADNFSVRWTGEVEAVFTETYTFYTNSDDGVRLWVDGQQLVDNWTDHGATENRGKINLAAGQTYSIVMEYYERDGGAVAELRWSSPRTPKQLIPQAALSLLIKANRPNPLNGATNVKQTIILRWSPGDYAVSHQVYFGTDEEAVRNADTTSPEYKAAKNLGSESYDPPGKLEWDTIYYWRVDEVNNVNPDSPWVGNLWSFTTADFLWIDDFESYNDLDPDDPDSNRIFNTWIDGWEIQTNGSIIGYAESPFTEQTIVHGGRQSMPYEYDTNFKYSEATYSPTQRDWTEEGVEILSLWFYGDAANAAERMYVALNGGTAVYHDNPNAAQINTWTEWTIELQEFTGVNLTNVNTLAIGFGDKNNLQAGGTGMVFFDDIRLYRPAEPQP